MKRIIGFAILFLLAICSLSCDTDPYAGKRPIDFPGSIWVCESPIYIYIEYNQNNELEEAYIYRENSEPISVQYGLYDNSLVILDNKDRILLKCHAEYSKSECILTVYESNLSSVNVGDDCVLSNTTGE